MKLNINIGIGLFINHMVEKRTIFLELPCEIIEKIDTRNHMGDRSLFITKLLEKQLQNENSKTDIAEMETK